MDASLNDQEMALGYSNNLLVQIIESEDDSIRNQSLDTICSNASLEDLQQHVEALDSFWRETDNLYHRVRSLFFFQPFTVTTFASFSKIERLEKSRSIATNTCYAVDLSKPLIRCLMNNRVQG